MKHICLLTILIFFLSITVASAEEIFLKNGDRISGTIIATNERTIEIQTEAMGMIVVDQSFIRSDPEPDLKLKSAWSKKASFGYNQAGGNTESQGVYGKFTLHKKENASETNFELRSSYASSNKKITEKKFYGMGRWARSFGEQLKWYDFYKLEGDQDRFANINYRMIPSVGVGYWFSDAKNFKLMIESALGFEHTNYIDNTKSSNEAILVPRLFVEKSFAMSDLKISEDIKFYPSLSEIGEHRLYSELSISSAITQNLSWRLSFIDEFDSNPQGGAKRNDFRIISALEYSY